MDRSCWSTVVVAESGAAFLWGGMRDPAQAGVRMLAGGDLGPRTPLLAVAVGGKTESDGM